MTKELMVWIAVALAFVSGVFFGLALHKTRPKYGVYCTQFNDGSKELYVIKRWRWWWPKYEVFPGWQNWFDSNEAAQARVKELRNAV